MKCTKHCPKCETTKKLDDFNELRGRPGDGYQGYCKECMRIASRQRADRNIKLMHRYKMMKGCEVCGYKEHPLALTFDHLDPSEKAFTIGSAGPRRKLATLKAEIRKCRVICANCHNIHSGEQRGVRF